MNEQSHIYLSAGQIRAARALLNWSQDDLAKSADLSVATIRKLELGYISPRGTTIRYIRQAFENAGLEFIEPDGVRHRPDDVVTYQGHNGIIAFFDDVYHTMSKKGGDVVVVCPSEVPVTNALAEYKDTHFNRMMGLVDKVCVRCILTENNAHLPADYCEYRWISKHYVDSVPFYVYDDKYAIIVFEADPSPKITIIRSSVVAEAFRHQFYSMWEKATVLSSPKHKVIGGKDKFVKDKAAPATINRKQVARG